MSFITHNLRNRLTNPNYDFEPIIGVAEQPRTTFDQSASDVCELLYNINRNIFVGLSGGVDSEYVFRKFNSLSIPVTPIIVECECYVNETVIAHKICKEYQVDPVVITITEKDLFMFYYENIYKAFNGPGIGSVPSLMATEYAKQNDGIFIKSDHTISDTINKLCVEMYEWDFYCNIQHDNSYNFFMMTPEIVYSIVSAMYEQNSQVFKCDLFGIPYRDKIYPKYAKHITLGYNHLIYKREFTPNFSYFADPKTFIEKHFRCTT
jgi:hypothetical protein